MIAFGLVLAGLLWTAHPQAQCVLSERPDPRCTPGDVDPIPVSVVCGNSTQSRRHVTAAMRKAVLSAYGIKWSHRASVVVDHRVPVSLGGASDPANLWPMSIDEAASKDRYEATARRLVCSGRMSLADAQRAFLGNWKEAF